jgi:hypothetical protein
VNDIEEASKRPGLVAELVGAEAAELASEAGAFRTAGRQLGAVCSDDVHERTKGTERAV